MPSVATSITAIELFPRNTLRKSLIVENEDTTDAVFIKRERVETPTISSTDHDHRIGPGGSLSLNSQTDGLQSITDRWTVVAAANTPRISWFETEDVAR